MYYNPKEFTWGYEIEWGDIDRRLVVPAELGAWEYSETDVVNTREPYKNVACDPLGLDPPFGGEINVVPTKTLEALSERIAAIKAFFEDNGCPPSAGSVNEGHVHIHVPGLRDDIEGLHNLTKYIWRNQQDAIDACSQFVLHPTMQKIKGATNYLKYDIGRTLPDYIVENIINNAGTFEEFIRLHAAGKDGISMGRPFRYAINMYSMKHIDTIEFRLFRSSTNNQEILDSLLFVREFMDAALNTGESVESILEKNSFVFPPFVWNPEEYIGWMNTKYDKSRGKKARSFSTAT